MDVHCRGCTVRDVSAEGMRLPHPTPVTRLNAQFLRIRDGRHEYNSFYENVIYSAGTRLAVRTNASSQSIPLEKISSGDLVTIDRTLPRVRSSISCVRNYDRPESWCAFSPKAGQGRASSTETACKTQILFCY